MRGGVGCRRNREKYTILHDILQSKKGKMGVRTEI